MDQEIESLVDRAVQQIADRLVTMGKERAATIMEDPPKRQRAKLTPLPPGTDSIDRVLLRTVAEHPGESIRQIHKRAKFPLYLSSVRARAEAMRDCGLLQVLGFKSKSRWFVTGAAPVASDPPPPPVMPVILEKLEAHIKLPAPQVDVVGSIRSYLEGRTNGASLHDLWCNCLPMLNRKDAIRTVCALVDRGTLVRVVAHGFTLFAMPTGAK